MLIDLAHQNLTSLIINMHKEKIEESIFVLSSTYAYGIWVASTNICQLINSFDDFMSNFIIFQYFTFFSWKFLWKTLNKIQTFLQII